MLRALALSGILMTCTLSLSGAQPPEPTRKPLVRVLDLNVGEEARVTLCDGKSATVKVLNLEEQRDPLCNAVRAARVAVLVNDAPATLTSATYHLPLTVGGVRIDCPITKGYRSNSRGDAWGLDKDVRLRLWPEGSSLVEPGTFGYPAKQEWFASDTQMANEPVFVDGGDLPGERGIYYHSGLDLGGAEGMVEVVAATDGLVVSAAKETLPGYDDTPVSPRYDVVYLLDERGWYYRYSHLHTIDATIRPGARVKLGQKIGLLGKEGASGGWSHLHFEIKSRQPSGKWGTQEGYAFLWAAYLRSRQPEVIAVARPHHLAWTGDKVTLDASRSWTKRGRIHRYDWLFSDGAKAEGPNPERTYEQAGAYSEILKVTDERGQVDYDFAVVQVIDRARPEQLPPTIHAAFSPTTGIRIGDEITFKVRTFRTQHGEEVWNFGDGSAPVTVRSDGNAVALAKDGYAVTTHRFQKPGDYLVSVSRANEQGMTATARLHVRVGEAG